MQIRAFMTQPVVTVYEDASLEEVARTMLEHHIGGVPVVNAQGQISGIITVSDFAAKEQGIPFSTFRAPQVFGHWLGGEPLEQIYAMARQMTVQDIPLEQLADIAIRLHLQIVPKGQVILRQGEPGDYMYFIAHGVVRVARAEHGEARDLATMMAGEFFGEAALLSGRQPRNATVTAVTPCTLYRLHRDDLRVAMATQPAIRKALEEESRKRLAMHYAG